MVTKLMNVLLALGVVLLIGLAVLVGVTYWCWLWDMLRPAWAIFTIFMTMLAVVAIAFALSEDFPL